MMSECFFQTDSSLTIQPPTANLLSHRKHCDDIINHRNVSFMVQNLYVIALCRVGTVAL